MQVKDVMTPDPACCTVNDGLQQVAQMMVDYDCGAIPVLENHNTKRLVGIITDRDMTARTIARGRDALRMTAGEVMSTPVFTVTPDDRVDEIVERMEEKQVRRLPVVDDQFCCCGIVSQADIALNTSKGTTGGVVQKVSVPNLISLDVPYE